MKKLIFLFAFAAMVTLSCDEIDKLTQFKMPYNESIVISSSTVINLPFDIFTPDISTNSSSTFEGYDTAADLIEKIKLGSLKLTLTSPSDANFSFLQSVNIYISAEGLSEEKIAWKESIPESIGKTIELETSTVNLKEYIFKDKIKLRVNTVTNRVITSDHYIDLNAVFNVDAKILGQ